MTRLLLRYVRQHHVGLLALFIALGGTAYAATLPRNSVGTRQLKRNAVTSPKVKNGSLFAKDFKAGQLPAGPRGLSGAQGRVGPKGDTGADGTAVAYAFIKGSGTTDTVDESRSKGITDANVTHPNTGNYCFHDVSFVPDNVQVTPDFDINKVPATITGSATNANCPPGTQFSIQVVQGTTGTLANASLNVLFN